MKLIDLLVKELPKRGGWPDGAVEAGFLCSNTTLYFVDANGDCPSEWRIEMDSEVEDNDTEINEEQYESALAASQKVEWSGDGLPPVGCECEVSVDGGHSWCAYRAINEKNGVRLIEIGNLTEEFQNNNWIFRPLRTEAERKRDEAAEAIDFYMPEFIPDTPNEFYHAKKIYDAIAAGKIPGVKLED